jgi:thioredoxin reductase (NADPH)
MSDSSFPVSNDKPAMLIVEDDQKQLMNIRQALLRCFGADYRVLTASSEEQALGLLRTCQRQDVNLALIAASLRLPGAGGVALIAQAKVIYPATGRALLIEAGDRGAMDVLLRATALGQIDFSLIKQGWVSPDVWLYPQVQEVLTAWAKNSGPRFEMVHLIGEQWSPRSHELRDLLTRNVVPFGFDDADSPAGKRRLAELNLDGSRLPVAILFDGRVLVDPSNLELAGSLGVRTRPDSDLYDLVIVGAGPAGLAASVYGASEGLRTVVIEAEALGGQAGTSSMIRNFLGFPRGVSGGELTSRAYEQAFLFGAQFVFMHRAVGFSTRGQERIVTLSDGCEARAKSVIVATGVSYRRLGIPSLDRLLGAGVFYGTASSEAAAMAGEQVYVLGGGNSAGQAALHLAKFADRVTILVRGDSLHTSMSEYLITEIEANPVIEVRFHTRVIEGAGEHHLEMLTFEDCHSGERLVVDAAALFVLIGAEPRTEWLPDSVQRDEGGYILTHDEIDVTDWPLARRPMALETSIPGVFAVGDVRANSVKRVASAVGEGSISVRFVHNYLAEYASTG